MVTLKTFLKRPKVILWVAFLILLLTLIFQNVEATTINIFFWSLPAVPKLVLILLSMVLGSLVTLLITWEFRHHQKSGDL